ncbi:hypothetical protein, partial [Streptomyces sp. NRRL S-146]|uniref:hypothetical protein n=1 Tax=Streptomyces sp. NRRL S-146 TaxID=1463884 RepID=UPI001F2CDA76
MQALGVNRGSGRGRFRRAICPADHPAPTVEHKGTGVRRGGSTMASRNGSRETDDSPQGSPDRPGTAGIEDGAVPADALVRIHDLAGRPRGTGFLADHHGTLITSHEAVDGLPRLVLH